MGALDPSEVRTEPLTMMEARAQGRLVLVAEDDHMNQKVILRQLGLLGYAGEVANDGAEALELWRRGSYAMLLSDLHMPNMDGYDLVAAIRGEEPAGTHLPVIALTANALRGEADRARAAGMDGYLTKPVPLATLREVLERWIVPRDDSRRTPVSPGADEMAADPSHAGATVSLGVLEREARGDAAAVRARIADFLTDARSVLAALHAAAAATPAHGQWRSVGTRAAALKILSRSVGALRLAEQCGELENAVARSEPARIARALHAVDEAFAAVEAELENLPAQGRGHGPTNREH
jgi:CheY-like chemotaxis protein